MAQPAIGGVNPPPGAGVPVKVSVPPTANDGATVVVTGSVACNVGDPSKTLDVIVDAHDWLNPPTQVTTNGTIDGGTRQSFKFALTAKANGGKKRKSKITIQINNAPAKKASATIELKPKQGP